MKTRIAVVFGSRSAEHDVSIVTAFGVMKVLEKMDNIQIYPIYITRDGKWIYSPDFTDIKKFPYKDGSGSQIQVSNHENNTITFKTTKNGLFDSAKDIAVDCIFPLVHGANGEDGTLQGRCETYNIPYVGPNIQTASRTIDKVMTKRLLQSIHIPVLPYTTFSHEESTQNIIATIKKHHTFPLFVKPYNAGSSIGVSKVSSAEDLEQAIQVGLHYASSIIVENAVNPLIELNCAVSAFGNKITATLVEQPVSHTEYLSFEEKYVSTDGGTMQGLSHKLKIPADVPQDIQNKIQEYCMTIYRQLNLTGAPRIDFLYNPETQDLFVCEINAVPGNMQMHLREHSNLSKEQFLQNLVDQAFSLHHKRQGNIEFNSNILQHTTSFAK